MSVGHNSVGRHDRPQSEPMFGRPWAWSRKILRRLKFDDGVRGDVKLSEIAEQKEFAHYLFAHCAQTPADREQYERELRDIQAALQGLYRVGEREVMEELKQGSMIAQGAYSPFEPEIYVPPSLWKFLELDFDRAEAKGLSLTIRDMWLVRFKEFGPADREVINQQIAEASYRLEKLVEAEKGGPVPLGDSALAPANQGADQTQQAKGGEHATKAQLRPKLNKWLIATTNLHSNSLKKENYFELAQKKFGADVSRNLFNEAWRNSALPAIVKSPGAPRKNEP